MKKVVLFDIDRTLIDTDTIKIKRLEAIADTFKIDFEKVDKARYKYLDSLQDKHDYNPYDLMKILAKELSLEYEDIVHTHDNPQIIRDWTYPDANLVMSRMNSKEFGIGICSEGWDHYQRYKLSASGLHNYFEEKLIFISRRKKNPDFIKSLPRPIIIVDDLINFLEELLKYDFVTPVWLNRKDKTKHKTIRTIASLLELPELLNETT